MLLSFNPNRLNRYASILSKVIKVFYICSIIVLVGVLVLGVLCIVAPSEYFSIENFKTSNFGFEINGLLRYSILDANLPSNTSFKNIFISIVIGGFIYAAALICMFRSLNAILKSVVEGAPFHPKNSKRISSIAFVIIIGSFIFPALNFIVTINMVKTFMLNNLTVVYSVDIFLLVTGLLLMILSGIFKYGSYLQNEYDETV